MNGETIMNLSTQVDFGHVSGFSQLNYTGSASQFYNSPNYRDTYFG